MNLEEIITKIEKLDDQIKSINKSLTTFNNKINEVVDDKTSGFLDLMMKKKKSQG
jgi:prefoldin subunit 5